MVDEDLSLKLRKQKFMESELKDFNGLPENIEDRFKDCHKTHNFTASRPIGMSYKQYAN